MLSDCPMESKGSCLKVGDPPPPGRREPLGEAGGSESCGPGA